MHRPHNVWRWTPLCVVRLSFRSFYLQFQPQIELETGRGVRCRSVISAGIPNNGETCHLRYFVRVLEDTGPWISTVGEWGVEKTCEAL